MTCAEFLEELNDYLDDVVDSDVRVQLERHLGKCSGCRVIWDTTRKTVRIFKGLDPYTLPPDLESRVLNAIARSSRSALHENH